MGPGTIIGRATVGPISISMTPGIPCPKGLELPTLPPPPKPWPLLKSSLLRNGPSPLTRTPPPPPPQT